MAGGLGERLGVDPGMVRIAFLVLTAAGGAGLLLYLVGWVMAAPPGAVPAVRREPSVKQAVAFGLIVLGLLLLLRELHMWFGDELVWPLALAGAGAAVTWVRGSGQSGWVRQGTGGSALEAVLGHRASLLRAGAGALLVMGGAVAFLAGDWGFAALGSVMVSMAVTAVGLGLMMGPWIARLARQAREERHARIRSEERAEMAAHLHDSVLHTLALIQRSDAPAEVLTLARRQERELRSWLYGSAPSEARLGAAVEAVASRVEELHNVTVDAVVVGDGPLDERAQAVVLACQEAAINAARHAGTRQVSVFVEAGDGQITAYVLDKGKGFDRAAVPGDRRGIAESIEGRMRRHGGSATIITAPGEGTEVQLRIPVEEP